MKNNFIKIYSTLNATEGHLVKFLFENNGIETILDNDKINFFFGIISAKDAMTDIWVPADKYKQATRLLLEKSSIDLSKYKQIACPRCGRMNCGLFDYCWKCITNLRSGELYARSRKRPGGRKAPSMNIPQSIYILVVLFALLIAGYLIYYYLYTPR